MRYKETITSIPTYNDGCFELYEIKQKDTTYPEEYIKKVTSKSIWFRELSISNNLKFQADQREVNLTMKIRIPQTKEITSMNVLKIGKEYHKVFNAYHFVNDEGFKETDLTLQDYPNPILEERKSE